MFLGLKLLNVFGIACVGSAQLYLATFCDKALGLKPDIIGFIYSITPFVSCVAFPLWMSRIDKTKSYKKTMTINMLIALVFFLSVSLVPSVVQVLEQEQAQQQVAAILVSVGYLGYAFFGYPVIGIMTDSATLYVLGDRKQELYGKQKMGTPIGFGLSVFLTGVLMDAWGPYAIFVVFCSSVLAFVLTCLVTDFTPRYTSVKPPLTVNEQEEEEAATAGAVVEDDEEIIDQRQRPTSTKDLLALPHAVRFYFSMTILGAVMGVMIAFLFLFVQKELHGTPAMVGLLGPLASCVEVVCFFFAKQIFHSLGPQKMIVCTHGILMFRCIAYMLATYLPSGGALLVMVIQPLHGLAYSLLWSAAVVEADTIAPPALKARAQGLLGTVYLGLGTGLGTIASGYIYSHFGAHIMWFMIFILTCLSACIYYRNPRGYHRVASSSAD